MSMLILFLGLLPLLAFVILDSLSTMKTAIVSALAIGFIELIFSFYFFGGLDWISIVIFFLFIFMGLISIKMNSPLSFKLQPALVSFLFGFSLFISYFIGHPLLAVLLEKYQEPLMQWPQFFNLQEQFGMENLLRIFTIMTFTSSIAFLIHGLLVTWAALKLSKWWWIFIKAVAIYPLLFLSSLLVPFISL